MQEDSGLGIRDPGEVSVTRKVGIIGLGLMGGSLARELSERGVQVFGDDENPETVTAALRDGALHGRLRIETDAPLTLDLLVLATPLDAAIPILHRVAALLPSTTLITDLCSTKQTICAAALALGIQDRFVGSHPLAGDHRSGWGASRAGLFREATVFLTPAGEPSPAIEIIESLWRGLGAHPVRIDPAEHDRRMAWISHLPQALASALAATLADRGFPSTELGPGGRDMTRLAASSPQMWTAIAIDNAPELEIALQEVQNRLSSFGTALQTKDRDAILAYFREANGWFQ